MADITFTIGVKDDGTPVLRNFKREVEGMGTGAERAATRASGAFGLMQKAVAGIAFAHVAAEAIRMADTFNLMEGRLRLVTASQEELSQVQDALFASAQRTRTGLEGTVDLYTSLARNAKGLGASQTELLQVTESINQAMQISGTSAASAQAALVQLGQGFASGTLRGEELNSILEQTPRLAEAIATGMGVTVGQLRQLGQDGELTAKAVFDALKSQKEAIDTEFAQLPRTVGGALTQLGNSLLQFVGNLDESTEATSRLARGLEILAIGIDFWAEKVRKNTMAEEFAATLQAMGNLQRKVDDLRANGSWVESVFGLPVLKNTEEALRLVTQRAQELSNQLQGRNADGTMFKQISDAAFFAATAVDAFRLKVVALTPEQTKLQESIAKQLGALKDQEAQLRLTAREFVEYQAAQLKGKGYNDEQIAQFRALSLQTIAHKEATEAATKAQRDKTKADQDAATEAKKLAAAEADLREEEEQIAEGILNVVDALHKDAATRAERLGQLQEEITQLEEEGRLLKAALGPREELLKLEKETALAREDRATASALAADGEKKLGAAEQAMIQKAGDLRKENIELAASNDKIAESQKGALLTTNDLRDGFHDMLDSLLEGDWKGALDVIERKGKELGARMIEGFVFGKGDVENKVLIPNFEEVFGQGNTLGGLISKAGNWLGQLFGREMASGIQGSLEGGGGIFGGAGTGDSIGAGGIFGGAGNAGTAGGKAGSAYGAAFSYAAIVAAAVAAGKDFSKGKYGSGGGAIVGGAIGAYFGGPQGAALGAMVGKFLGSFLDPLFKHMPTKGTLIRKGVKEYLKEIGVSFSKEIDSADYFFEETKKLASKMFGGDFLAASKQILTDKAGPELAKQLQALGTAITADQAIKLGKSLEQTGTTFGNMLLDNLGLDEIPAAIAEIIQKGDFTFANLTDKLTEVFKKNAIGVDFYKDTIQGAVDLFYGDLPEAIHASAIALKSFTDGAFDLAKFEVKLQEATKVFDLVVQSFRDAIANSETGTMAAELFGAQLKAGLEALAIEAYLTQFIDEKLFAGIDLGNGLDSSEIELLTARTKEARIAVEALREGFAGAETNADALVQKIRDLQSAIQDIANERIEIRLQLLDDLVSIGVLDALDAIAARIESIQDRITQIIGEGRGSRPLSELSDEDLTHLIRLQAELRNAILARYREEAAAIQAAAQAQIAAIRDEYAAKRAEIQEAINRLQEQRNETQRFYQEQINALQEQLRVAEAFRDLVTSINDMIRTAVQSPQSPLDPQQQLGFLQREEAALRAKLVGATGAERVRLIQELAQILQQQLQFVDRNTVNGQQLFQNIIRELTALRDEAAREADKAADLQRQIAAATAAMDAALKSIDAQIAAQQKLLADLSAQEAAAIAAVEATAKEQLEALRKETAQQLLDLARKTDEAKVEQLRRLEAQLATAKEQLVSAVGAEAAAKLLAAGDEAHLVIQAQQLATLHSIDQHIIDAFNQQNQENNSAPVPTLHAPSVGSPVRSGTSSGGVIFTFAPVVNVTVEPGEEQRVKADMEEVLRLAEQRFGRKLETDWAPKIRRIAEGGI